MGIKPSALKYECQHYTHTHTHTHTQFRVTGCTDLLKHIHPPWTESVESLIRECLDVDHPNVAELQKQYKLLQLKKMLHGYSVRDFNFSDDSKGRVGGEEEMDGREDKRMERSGRGGRREGKKGMEKTEGRWGGRRKRMKG